MSILNAVAERCIQEAREQHLARWSPCLRFFVLEMGALEGFLVCRTADGSPYDSMSSYSSGFIPPSPGEEPSAVIVSEQDWICAEEEEMERAKPTAKQQQRPRHVRFVEWFGLSGKKT